MQAKSLFIYWCVYKYFPLLAQPFINVTRQTTDTNIHLLLTQIFRHLLSNIIFQAELMKNQSGCWKFLIHYVLSAMSMCLTLSVVYGHAFISHTEPMVWLGLAKAWLGLGLVSIGLIEAL